MATISKYMAGISCSVTLSALLVTSAFAAAERGSEPEAEAMVKQAVALIKSGGTEKPTPLLMSIRMAHLKTVTCIFLSTTLKVTVWRKVQTLKWSEKIWLA